MLFAALFLFPIKQSAFAQSFDTSKIKVNALGRIRGEVTNNHDFNNSVEDKNNFVGSRFRLSFDFSASPNTQIFMEYQYSKTWGLPSGNLQNDPSSIHQAFIQHKFCDCFSLKIGRQELSYGDELLIGAVAWSNVGRSFDAFKTRWSHSLGWTDFFIADVTQTLGASATNDHYFSGLYNHLQFESIDNLDLYVLHSQDPSSATNEVVHYGTRVKSIAGSIDYRVEATGQTELDAHQWDGEFGYTLGRSRVSLGAFSSSKNFFQLYPTAHKWLGTGDFVSRRNISGLRLGTSRKITDKLKSKLDYHIFQRTDEKAPAYAFNGSPLTVSGQNKDLGSEVNLNVAFKVDKNFSVSVNGAHFFVGQHLKENGLKSDGDAYYLQTTALF